MQGVGRFSNLPVARISKGGIKSTLKSGCGVKETLFIRDLQPSLNEYACSEKLHLKLISLFRALFTWVFGVKNSLLF